LGWEHDECQHTADAWEVSVVVVIINWSSYLYYDICFENETVTLVWTLCKKSL
jgi:hypothetical protein